MKSLSRLIDSFQIVGFTISTAVSIVLIFINVDPVLSTILGLILAALTQLFDLQLRLANSEDRLLQANALSEALYRDEWLLKHIQQIVDCYLVVKGGWFELFKIRAQDAISECRNVMDTMAEGSLAAPAQSAFMFSREAFEKAKKFLKVTAIGDIAFWRSNNAEGYFSAQCCCY